MHLDLFPLEASALVDQAFTRSGQTYLAVPGVSINPVPMRSVCGYPCQTFSLKSLLALQ
jgi:hypothetical protein